MIMTRRVLLPFLLLFAIAFTVAAQQEAKLTVGKDDTVRSVLAAHVGKRVTLKLDADELTGIVRSVGDHTVHLGELTGKEFFDAVVDLDEVSAVLIRVK
jgi:hypothetical protein